MPRTRTVTDVEKTLLEQSRPTAPPPPTPIELARDEVRFVVRSMEQARAMLANIDRSLDEHPTLTRAQLLSGLTDAEQRGFAVYLDRELGTVADGTRE